MSDWEEAKALLDLGSGAGRIYLGRVRRGLALKAC